jgi:alkylhydroperoxidase family enzyme
MIRHLVLKRLDAMEQTLGESVDYMRHVVRVSLPAFLKFALFTPLAAHGRKLPINLYYTACFVATRHEDCGTCVQITVNMARRDGVPDPLLHALIAGNPEELADEARDVYLFTHAVVNTDEEKAAPLRERLRAVLGEEALIELSFAIAGARVFPTVKRGLGYATSCALVEIR